MAGSVCLSQLVALPRLGPCDLAEAGSALDAHGSGLVSCPAGVQLLHFLPAESLPSGPLQAASTPVLPQCSRGRLQSEAAFPGALRVVSLPCGCRTPSPVLRLASRHRTWRSPRGVYKYTFVFRCCRERSFAPSVVFYVSK